MTIQVVRGDLFELADKKVTVSLAHCVSADFRLGKGIAKEFRKKFGRIHELHLSGQQVGGVAVLKDNERFIYNLVTKKRFSDKGNYFQMRQSLEAMRQHAKHHNVHHIAMPKIGCGLDRLSWDKVLTIIQDVFGQEPICITVCFLETCSL